MGIDEVIDCQSRGVEGQIVQASPCGPLNITQNWWDKLWGMLSQLSVHKAAFYSQVSHGLNLKAIICHLLFHQVRI